MNEIKLLSKCKKIKDIPWDDTIYVSKIMFDPNLFETHKARIDKVFASAPEEVKQQQLQNILMRDTLFNLVMDKVVNCYEFELNDEDVNKFVELLKKSMQNYKTDLPADKLEQRYREIAKKLIQKELIFSDIADEYKIQVNADETMQVLNEYQKSTGNSIDEIKSDKNKLSGAVGALLEEKITAFIINNFKNKDFSELQKNIQLDNEMNKKNNEENK